MKHMGLSLSLSTSGRCFTHLELFRSGNSTFFSAFTNLKKKVSVKNSVPHYPVWSLTLIIATLPTGFFQFKIVILHSSRFSSKVLALISLLTLLFIFLIQYMCTHIWMLNADRSHNYFTKPLFRTASFCLLLRVSVPPPHNPLLKNH